jgi:OmpA-OmpF porin, OOP family
MNNRFVAVLFICLLSYMAQGQINNPGQAANDAATNQANNDINNAANNGVNKAQQGIGNMFKKKNKPATIDSSHQVKPVQSSDVSQTDQGNSTSAQNPPLKLYVNYDFVPGDKIIFEDNFADDRDAEFPSHWELEKGQAILNKLNGLESFYLTDGNYCRVSPLVKNKSYLTNQFTVEYDLYNPNGAAYGLMLFLKDAEGNDIASMQITPAESDFTADTKSLQGSLPAEILNENFNNRWHHIALAYNNKQIKVYVDQFRVLYVPNGDVTPVSVGFGGVGAQDNPIIFRNIRIAEGGNMYMVGHKFTDSKIVTHGINFDLDKSSIKPESMGTLNMIVQILKDNPDIKFEIDGHTDNTGSASHNMTLSQQRADAVKSQLVTMGISSSRLTSKGFGDSKPISDNNTSDGKANNRRVEFVKMQ